MNNKDFQALTIADPFMFHEVMQQPENCKPLLEGLIGKAITTITPASEHELLGIHMIAQTHDELTYNISLQMADVIGLERRVRLSHSLMDSEFLDPDELDDEAKRSCVIALCDCDWGGRGKCVYKIEWKIDGEQEPFYDDTCTLLLNPGFTDGNAPKNVRDFLHWFNACRIGKDFDISQSTYLIRLANAVEDVKADPFMEIMYNAK